jgi:hypothetical protein
MAVDMPYLLIKYTLSRPALREALIVLLPPWGKVGKGVKKLKREQINKIL